MFVLALRIAGDLKKGANQSNDAWGDEQTTQLSIGGPLKERNLHKPGDPPINKRFSMANLDGGL